ncbi:MAG: AMP-binding protein [Taibaiella sp.]|nr:AMP-binding protein [Taibaiella sp.]
MSFQPLLAFESLEQQASYQNKELVKALKYLQERSPFYKKLFTANDIDVATIQTVAELHRLPTTSKSDMQEHNMEFLCVPASDVKEYTATSGTMGQPVYIALTENDLNRLTYNEEQSFRCADGSDKNIYQLMLTLDRQFMAGMAYYMGIRQLGGTVIRSGPGLPSMQLHTIEQLQPDSLVAVPSFLLKLTEYAREKKIKLSDMPVQKAICIGENIRQADFELNALGNKIMEDWPIKLYSTYASTEMQTAFTECGHGRGGHQQPDLIIIEILNEQGDVLPDGAYGELVITTLGVEAMPLLRYRTGDICAAYSEPCACGRKTRRLSPIVGRSQQMIKYKGTTLYPPAIFNILNEIAFIKEYVVEVYTNNLETDEIRLHINTPLPVDECETRLKPLLQSKLRVIPALQFHSAAKMQEMQFPTGSRKQVKFIDNRKMSL